MGNYRCPQNGEFWGKQADEPRRPTEFLDSIADSRPKSARICRPRISLEVSRSFYFFLPDPNVGCHPADAPFWLGAAAIVFIFSFLGFFFSRLLLCSPLAMSSSTG